MHSIVTSFIQGLEPERDINMVQWSDENLMLPKAGGASIEPGRYRSARTPFWIEVMECLSVTSPVTDVTNMKGTQLGATQVANNFFGYVVDVAPGSMMMVFPTDIIASGHSKSKLTPTIDETPCLKNKVIDRKYKGSSNTILTKDFPGGILFLSGANSPANARNKSVRYLVLDDYDGWPMTAGKEGDPGELFEKRTDNFSFRKKIYRNSTPTTKGMSRISDAYEESDQRSYKVPCPFCDHMQKLVWGGPKERKGIKFSRNKVGEAVAAWYECEKCHEAIDESHKPEMLAAGAWVAKYPRREKRGYHLSSLYSPLGWVSWLQIVKEFLAAKDNSERLKVWTNTRMAEVWDEEGSQPDWVLLKNRAEYYKIMTVPDPACFLSAGVDVQKDRLAAIVRGWGPGEESWLVYWGEIYGDPERDFVWTQLDTLLDRPFVHDTGTSLYIEQMAIDSGYATQSVYNYCRHRSIKTMATKGLATSAKPIINRPSLVDVNYLGEVIKDGCQLWTVGTDTAKSKIYSRLMQREPGPGYYHFPMGVDDEYYLQLTAEKKLTQYRNGFPMSLWTKLRDRNEVLDCEELALVAAYRAGMAFINWDKVRIKQLSGGSSQKKTARKKRPKPEPRAGKW